MTRAALVNRYARPLEALGVPSGRLLSAAGISAELLESPEAPVHLDRAFKFAELACSAVGSEHLALDLGLRPSLYEYGRYGTLIQKSLTVYEYLGNGIRLYNLLVTGQRLWLTRHGDRFRLNISSPGNPSLGAYQSHVEAISTTIAALRRSLGQHWSPEIICFAYKSRERPPTSDLFDGSSIIRGADISYLTIPASMMKRTFRSDGRPGAGIHDMRVSRPIPEDLEGLVKYQIECLLPGGRIHIDTVADSMMMSRRSLQRRLAEQQLTFSQLLSDVRFSIAAGRLENSDQPISEIAVELGYGEAANFTRAFRQRAGVTPFYFRTAMQEPSGHL